MEGKEKKIMKKLIFIDNDLNDKAKINLDTACRQLRYNGNLEIERNQLELVSEFHKVSSNMEDVLFSTDNALITWSMFTDNHFGSYDQLCDFMVMAGLSGVKGKIFIDTASYLKDTLERAIEHYNQSVYIIRCIENNFIIHYDEDEEKFFRLRFGLPGATDDFLFNENVDLNELLTTPSV